MTTATVDAIAVETIIVKRLHNPFQGRGANGRGYIRYDVEATREDGTPVDLGAPLRTFDPLPVGEPITVELHPFTNNSTGERSFTLKPPRARPNEVRQRRSEARAKLTGTPVTMDGVTLNVPDSGLTEAERIAKAEAEARAPYAHKIQELEGPLTERVTNLENELDALKALIALSMGVKVPT